MMTRVVEEEREKERRKKVRKAEPESLVLANHTL